MTRLVLENVHVDFPIYGATRSLRKTLFERATGGLISREERHPDRVVVNALNGVSLTVEEGDRLALLGHNGAGKSTILRVMAGIYEPISGRVLATGKITPLFDTMPGLDGEDTGYENIITAGLLFGMTRAEIESKIPEIEEFSELGEYLSLPVRTYSSGMMTRLGFSVATAIEPGILLMDEGISTGDARFTERASKRMREFIGRSRIMVLASHSEGMVRASCNKAALMHAGRIIYLGGIDDALDRYDLYARRKATPEDILEGRGIVTAIEEARAERAREKARAEEARGGNVRAAS
jgi:ABC-type polysaccharide/polyol phosphate transport system ATPase subunit